MSKKKLTLEEIQEKIYLIHPNILILGEFEKETGKTKKRITRFINCKCLIDKYEWSTNLSSLLDQKTGCPKCGGVVKLTLKEVKERLFIINPNILILSDKYINNKSNLKYKCTKCNYIWEAQASSLINTKSGCPNCFGNVKLTLIEIKEKVKKINPNIEILEDNEYINNKSNLKCKCLLDDYRWETSAHSLLSQESGCLKCSGKMKKTLEEVKSALFEINPNIIILSNEYIGIESKLKCKCIVDSCGYIWSPSANTLLNAKSGCPKCAIKNRSGENAYQWKGGISPLAEYLRHKIKNWKQDSFKKYNYICDITNEHDIKLTIHHLYNFSDIVHETMEILNLPVYLEINLYTDVELKQIESLCLKLHYDYGLGVCLSEEEHKLFHYTYGVKNNTKGQYIEFKELRFKYFKN